MVKKIVYKYRFQLLLMAVWLLILIVVNPLGEFAINDDWAYAYNTKALSEEGIFRFSFWPAMTLVSQTIWGFLISEVFGFSLFNLRMATLVLAVGSTLTFFALLKRETKNELISFGLTLALMSSPLFLSLSFSYMTEIYYLFFAGYSFYFFARFFRNERILDWVFAMIFVILMVMVRQTGLIYPIGFGIVFLLSKRFKFSNLIIALLPIILTYVSIEVYIHLRTIVDPQLGALSDLGDLFRSISEMDLTYFVTRIGSVFHYIGFAMIPVIVLLISKLKVRLSRGQWIRMSLLLVPIMYCMLSEWYFFPNGSMLQDFQLGPRLVKDVALFNENLPTPLSTWVWGIIRCLNVVSIAIFFYALFAMSTIQNGSFKQFFGITKSIAKRPFLYMILVIFTGQFVYIVINPIFFDRYTVPVVFTWLIIVGLLVSEISKGQRKVFFGIISICLLISSLLVKDYLSWHRARLSATDYLQNEAGISKNRIDGGLEFNAYHATFGWNPRPLKTTEKSWWFVDKDDFVIT